MKTQPSSNGAIDSHRFPSIPSRKGFLMGFQQDAVGWQTFWLKNQPQILENQRTLTKSQQKSINIKENQRQSIKHLSNINKKQ